MHLYRMSEWQDFNGKWKVNDVEELGTAAGYWWYPARILNISCDEYVRLLVEKYNACDLYYSESANLLTFSFVKLSDARKFKNEINKLARQKQYYIEGN